MMPGLCGQALGGNTPMPLLVGVVRRCGALMPQGAVTSPYLAIGKLEEPCVTRRYGSHVEVVVQIH